MTNISDIYLNMGKKYFNGIDYDNLSKFNQIIHIIYMLLGKIFLSWEVSFTNRNINCSFSHSVGVVISHLAQIGKYSILGQNTTIGKNSKTNMVPIIGQHCILGANCNLIGKVILQNNIILGAGCNLAECTIGENTHIGMGVTITHSNIGKNCKIISGTILNGVDIPDESIVKPQNGIILLKK